MTGINWAAWAKHYPVRMSLEPAYGQLPELVEIRRAGKTVQLTPEELKKALAELGFTLIPSPEPVAYIATTRHRHCRECNDLIEHGLNGARLLAGPESRMQRDGHGVTILHQSMEERREELGA